MRKMLKSAVPASASSGASERTGPEGDNKIPRGFVCPITQAIMVDPVIAADGHSYERSAIVRWFQSHQTSPMTNLPLPHKLLVQNHALKSSIDDFRNPKSNNSSSDDSSSDDDDFGVGFIPRPLNPKLPFPNRVMNPRKRPTQHSVRRYQQQSRHQVRRMPAGRRPPNRK